MRLSAHYLAEQIHLPQLRQAYAATPLETLPSELFYALDEDQFLYVFDFGVVVAANMSEVDISKNLLFIAEYARNTFEQKISDDFEIEYRPDGALKFGFDVLVAPKLDVSVIKIAMFNLAQSVALDDYSQRAQTLLSEVRRFADEMENRGGISISRRNMIRFIGRTLNGKNKIIENLYIFDSPEITWEDEYLDQVHRGLGRTLELQSRFKEVEYTFKIVEDNLSVFREIYMHRENKQLEWIIIILICIEVADLLISKVTHWF